MNLPGGHEEGRRTHSSKNNFVFFFPRVHRRQHSSKQQHQQIYKFQHPHTVQQHSRQRARHHSLTQTNTSYEKGPNTVLVQKQTTLLSNVENERYIRHQFHTTHENTTHLIFDGYCCLLVITRATSYIPIACTYCDRHHLFRH